MQISSCLLLRVVALRKNTELLFEPQLSNLKKEVSKLFEF